MKFIQSPNYTPVDKKLIVIHWIAGSFKGGVNWLTNKRSCVSAHYAVSKSGEVVQMVEEQDIAWHAGISSLPGYPTDWNGKEWRSLNPCSIGIELEGPPSFVEGMECWTAEMLTALANLCKEIAARNPGIKLTDHSTISPGRKSDVKGKTGHPEDIFPWKDFVKMTGLEEA